MTSREHRIVDLISDQTCIALMDRDGVRARGVLNLMKSVRPLVLTEHSYRRHREGLSRLVA